MLMQGLPVLLIQLDEARPERDISAVARLDPRGGVCDFGYLNDEYWSARAYRYMAIKIVDNPKRPPSGAGGCGTPTLHSKIHDTSAPLDNT